MDTKIDRLKDIKNSEELSLKERIINILKENKALKASKIAYSLGVSKKEVNQILYSNISIFVKDSFFVWRLKQKINTILKYFK